MIGYSVLVIDMYHYDEESEVILDGFPSFEMAKEYARRRTRDSLEEQRQANQSAAELRGMWSLFGEDCLVIGGESTQGGPLYTGYSEVDFFAEHPASDEERDWVGLGRQLRVRVRPGRANRS